MYLIKCVLFNCPWRFSLPVGCLSTPCLRVGWAVVFSVERGMRDRLLGISLGLKSGLDSPKIYHRTFLIFPPLAPPLHPSMPSKKCINAGVNKQTNNLGNIHHSPNDEISHQILAHPSDIIMPHVVPSFGVVFHLGGSRICDSAASDRKIPRSLSRRSPFASSVASAAAAATPFF